MRTPPECKYYSLSHTDAVNSFYVQTDYKALQYANDLNATCHLNNIMHVLANLV